MQHLGERTRPDEVILAREGRFAYLREIPQWLDFSFDHLVDERCFRILAVANDCTGVCLEGVCLELELVVTSSRRGVRPKMMLYVIGS